MKLSPMVAATPLLLFTLHAEVTPLDQALPDSHLTTITCDLKQPPPYSDIPVFKTTADAENTLGTYHYKLWLPEGYSADRTSQWPCMFIMDIGGNATMGTMEAWLKSNHFIVVMLVEAKGGPWGPIIGNFLAAHDDVIKRVRVGKKYATGISGGARASSIFVQLRPGFSGLILQAAGVMFDDTNDYIAAGLKGNPQLRIAMTLGSSDPNLAEVDPMKKLFGPEQLAIFEFNGGHAWAPPFTFKKAMAWLNGEGAGKPGASPADSFDDFFKKK